MADFEKWLKLTGRIDWRATYLVLGVSFLMASVVSTLLSFQFMPKIGGRTAGDQGREGDFGSGRIVSLTEADLKVIYGRNIFNKTGELGDIDPTGDEENEQIGDKAIKSDLPVEVLGIIYGGTPFNGLATIKNTSKNKINSFIVGDILLKKARVIEIHRRKVILMRENRREFIELEQKEIVRNKRNKKKKSSSGSGKYAPIARGAAPKSFKEEGFSRDGAEIVMSETYKQKLLTTDFTKVLQDAKASPYMVDGQIRGFKLTRIREGSIYVKAGLQNNDVVEEINGVPLSGAASAIRLLQSLRNEKEIEVVVNRGGRSMNMRLNVR